MVIFLAGFRLDGLEVPILPAIVANRNATKCQP